MVRAPEEFAAAAAPYVCARITDMREVDLSFVRFDFDLTMAVVLMHPDGTVYHRYGSRDADDPLSWTSLDGLVRLLDATLEDDREYRRAPSAPPSAAPLRPIDLPPLRRMIDEGQKLECVHCHTVNDIEHRFAVEQDRWRDADKWVYPEPARVGLELDPADQERIRAVAADSPAARAGLLPGDRLRRLGRQPRVRTIADVAWALHGAPPDGAQVPLTYDRGGEPGEAQLDLGAGWKECSPLDYAWRPYKWNLSPAPGFGGPALGPKALADLGLPSSAFAFRVQYLVTWGPRAHRGRAAETAGIRKGDVVLSFAGRSDFRSLDHFHAWIRLSLHAGDTVDVELLRSGERQRVRYTLPE